MKVGLRRGPNEIPWHPSHIYDCSSGHYVQADAPVSQCPAFHLGEPCRGELVQVGPKGGRVRTGAGS